MYYFINKIKKFINKVLKNSLISSRGFKKIEETDKCDHQFPITHRLFDKKEKDGIYRFCRCVQCRTITKRQIDTETLCITKSSMTPKKLLKELQRLDSRFYEINWICVQNKTDNFDGFVYDTYFSAHNYSGSYVKSKHVIVWTNKGLVQAKEASSGYNYIDMKGKKIYDKSVKIFLDNELHNKAVEKEHKVAVELP